MRDELYINGVKVDLGKANIDLNYKSNLLTDISKIVSNNSYTIKLPKTSKNLALIECVHIPSSVSRVPYLKHTGTLVRNGIEIVKDASVVLLSVSESIEVALSWGNAVNFATIVSGGKKLTDLEYGTSLGVDYTEWYKRGGAMYPRIDYGFRNGEDNVWYHPVVTAYWILNKIAQSNGVVLDIPSSKINIINSWIVPLLARNDAQKQIELSTLSLRLYYVDSIYDGAEQFLYAGAVFHDPYEFDENYDKYYGSFDMFSDPAGYEYYTTTYKTNISNARINLHGKLTMKVESPSSVPDGLTFALMQRSKRESILSFTPTRIGNISGTLYEISYEIDGQSDVVDGSGLVDFAFINIPSGAIFSRGSYGELTFTVQVDKVVLRTSNKNDGRYYFVPNLPDLKQIDFIKAITSMLGLFAIPNGTGGIKFISFDDLKDNVSRSVDWTSKLLEAYNDKTPRDIKYTLNDVAQNNRFKYKEEDAVKGIYDGNINIDDVTLDFERDAITLPFSACDTSNSVASIPIYSYDESGKLQYKKVNPRILLLEGTNGVFKGLEWGTLISNYYQTYEGLINEAKVITEYVRLNSIELRDLEMDVPVYFGQYGSYFSIIEIKTKENDVCECKLLKLEV